MGLCLNVIPTDKVIFLIMELHFFIFSHCFSETVEEGGAELETEASLREKHTWVDFCKEEPATQRVALTGAHRALRQARRPTAARPERPSRSPQVPALMVSMRTWGRVCPECALL